MRTDRRSLLRKTTILGAAGAAGAALATAGVAVADTRRSGDGAPTFVYVNGSNSTASNIGELGRFGYRAVTVGLPKHAAADNPFPVEYQAPQDLAALATVPSPLTGVSLDDYTEAAVEVVRDVAEFGPVILVGSSLGGLTLSRVGNEVPQLLSRIVYDTAMCCVELPTMIDYMQTEEGSTSLGPSLAPWMVGDPEVIGATRVNWRSADPEFLAAVKAVLLEDGTDSEVLALLATLQPDEASAVPMEDARVDADTWGTVPRSYIRHTLDRSIPIALQDLMIAEADALTPDNPFDVHTVETSHAGTVETQRQITQILVGLAR